jgi:hypothetical protein
VGCALPWWGILVARKGIACVIGGVAIPTISGWSG